MDTTTTRERIIDAARLLVQEGSYQGLTFRDVAEQVGIRKASVYHHFESKDALAIAMLDHALAGFSDWARRMESQSPRQKLEAFCFTFYGSYLDAGNKLCPGGAFTAAWPGLSDALRHAVNRLFDAQARFLRAALAQAYQDAGSPPPDDPDDVAAWIMSNIQGAIITARARGDAALFERLCERTLQHLDLPH